MENEVTTAQAIEEFAPLQRLGKAIEKLNKVLQATAGAEMREKVANETAEKLETSIITLDSTVQKRTAQLEEMERTRVVRKGVIEVEFKDYEDTETEELNKRLNRVRANIAKQEKEYAKGEADAFSRLRLQDEEIKAREDRYAELGKLIDKIQAKFSPVKAG